MKKNLFLPILALLAACNSNQGTQTEAMKPAVDSAMPAIQSPFPIGYSSKFVIDSPKNAESLLTLWKDWDNGDLSAHKNLFADTVEFYFAGGNMMRGSRDSTVAAAQRFRSSLASSVDEVFTIVALKSIDKNEHWALIWGLEKDTDKKGKVDSSFLQETWRFNDAGKANLMYQFRQAPPTLPKKAK